MVFMAVLCTFSNLSLSSFSCGHITPGGAWQALGRVGWSHLLSLLVILLQMQATIQFALGAAALHFWLMVSLLSPLPSGPFQQGCSLPHRCWPILSSLVIPFQVQDHACLCLFSQRSCCPTLPGSLCQMAFPCRYTPTSSPSLVSSANTVRVLWNPSPR